MLPYDFALAAPNNILDIYASVRGNGFAILRGAIAPAVLEGFRNHALGPAVQYWHGAGLIELERDDLVVAKLNSIYGTTVPKSQYHSWAANGYVTDAMLRYFSQSRHSFYNLLADAKFVQIAKAIGPGELYPSVQCHSRSIHPTRIGQSETTDEIYSGPIPFHFDYYYHKESRMVLNFWCPFQDVGPSVSTPTVRILRAPLRDTIRVLWKSGGECADDVVDSMSEKRVIERWGAENLVPLDLALGDIAVFSNWTLHQTYIESGMTKGRTSAEIRICREDHHFEKLAA